MSIVITNISDHDDLAGENDYALKINDRTLVQFKHERRQGLAACLRAAADAYEADPEDDWQAPETIPQPTPRA